MNTRRVAAAVFAGAMAAAVAVALAWHAERNRTDAALAASEQQRDALQAELTSLKARLSDAERRAAEAEKDSGELLKAVNASRGNQQRDSAYRAPAVAAAVATTPEQQERLAQERSYQQQLAKRRAEEAKARAKVESEAASETDAAARYNKLMEVAEQHANNADFQAGIRTFNTAMQLKPADVAVTDRIRQLQALLQAQNAPVEISLVSDGLTTVSVTGPYGQRAPSPLQSAHVRVLPGNYEVIGQRSGYQDVRIPVQVRNGVPAPVVSVMCTVPAVKQ